MTHGASITSSDLGPSSGRGGLAARGVSGLRGATQRRAATPGDRESDGRWAGQTALNIASLGHWPRAPGGPSEALQGVGLTMGHYGLDVRSAAEGNGYRGASVCAEIAMAERVRRAADRKHPPGVHGPHYPDGGGASVADGEGVRRVLERRPAAPVAGWGGADSAYELVGWRRCRHARS